VTDLSPGGAPARENRDAEGPGSPPGGDDLHQQPEEVFMIVMFTARRLKPGAWEQFRRAWDADGGRPPGLQRAYHARNIRDEDEVISFGVFDMTEQDYHRWREEADAQETQRVDRMSAFVENEHVAGVYEVIDTVDA
jgi:heme-degrading monooxygenase HmoA